MSDDSEQLRKIAETSEHKELFIRVADKLDELDTVPHELAAITDKLIALEWDNPWKKAFKELEAKIKEMADANKNAQR